MRDQEENKKYRHEYKFLIDARELALLENRIRPMMSLDAHAESGSYRIRSAYFDDMRDTCYHQNEAGVDPRTKFRIRIYDASEQRISLEKKSKKNGMTHKEAAPLTKEQSLLLLAGKIPPVLNAKEEAPQLLKQFTVLMKTRRMQPKVIVEYERIPFIYKQGNVRITFDKNVSSSRDFQGFFDERILKYPIMAPGQHILEVKYDEFLPSFIKNQLELGSLTQTSFSKYYLCRRYM